MPKGIYKRTENAKKNIIQAVKKRYKRGEKFGFQKGNENYGSKFGAWNKGLPNPSLIERNKKRKGEIRSEEFRRKISETHKGKMPKNIKMIAGWNKGKKLSEETKQKLREWNINNPNKVFKNTSIELKIEAELKNKNINYQKQVPLCKVTRVDFYLPEYRIVIQCDGDYWHNLPKVKERDEKQNKVLIFNGFNVYRFWEHEINESPKKCVDKLFKSL